MSGRQKLLLVLPVFALVASVLHGGLGNADMTNRLTDINEKRFPMKMHDMEMNSDFSGKRFPMKQWETEFSPLGRKRASIAVEESGDKKIRRPKMIEMEKVDRKMSPMDGRRAFLRNGENVPEKQLVPRYRDAKVTNIGEMSRPEMSPRNDKGEQRELSMREINRFTFQRNHSDQGGASVQRAGSGESRD